MAAMMRCRSDLVLGSGLADSPQIQARVESSMRASKVCRGEAKVALPSLPRRCQDSTNQG